MINRLFSYIENQNISIGAWVTSVLSIVLLRMFLENFSGVREGAVFVADIQTYIHYALFYLVTILLFTIIVKTVTTQKNVARIAKIFGFGLVLTLLPPIIDLVATMGQGTQITYIFGSSQELLRSFLTFYGTETNGVATLGIRTELLIVFLFVFLYIRYLEGSKVRALLGTFVAYIGLFFLATLPNYLSITTDMYWVLSLKSTILETNLIHPLMGFKGIERAYEIYFNGILSQAYYLLLVLITSWFFYLWRPQTAIAVIKNSRWERVSHYLLMIFLGIFIAVHEGVSVLLTPNWMNISAVLILLFSFYSIWMYSVCMNDIVDHDSDKISNSHRPLVRGIVNVAELKVAGYIFFTFALLGGYVLGYKILFLVAVYATVAHLYTNPPLQLKRFAIINSASIATATTVAVLAGFFTVSLDSRLDSFPSMWLVLIFITYTLFANIKDIKDIKGDREVGVYTLPVLLGEKNGILIIWALVTIGLFCIPILLNEVILWLPSIFASGTMFFILRRKPFIEKNIFIAYFIYAGLGYLLYIFVS